MNDYGTDEPTAGGPGGSEQWFEEARRRVQTPGTILVVFGLISIFLAVASLALDIVSPDTTHRWAYDFIVDMQKGQPQQNQQKLPPYEEWVKQQQMQSIAGAILGIVGSIFIVLGGSKMKQLHSYGLAVTGSIMAIIPCTNSCCCTSIPFGIWALVVLLNSDVKLAFARTSAGPAV